MKLLPLIVLLTACPAYADISLSPVPQENLDSFVLDQLICLEKPDAVRVSMGLAVNKKIDLTKNVGRQAVDCFEVEEPWDLFGLPVHQVCGVWDNSIDHFMFPGIGSQWTTLTEMFPTHSFSIFSPFNVEEAITWSEDNKLNSKVEETPRGTQIECSRWIYEGPTPRG